jgi:carbon monoxide dehydrogenase subunit G
MRIVGSAVLGADRGRVWAALRDPGVLVRAIPGCERLEALGGDVYRMTVSAGVASIKGIYQGEVALAEPDEPERFVLKARGQGAPGTVDATVEVALSEVDGGGTRVDYDAEAVIGGMIGGVGGRMLSSVAKRTAEDFFAAIDRHLAVEAAGIVAESPAGPLLGHPVPGRPVPGQSVPGRPESVRAGSAGPEVVAEAGGPSAPAPRRPVAGQVFTAPAAAPRPGAPAWALLAAFGMGAGVALGGAAIGWLFGRAGRRHR